MPILDLQKRSRELGRIRLGQKGDRGQPQKLDRFRFTSHSEALIRKIAELYGGEARPWTPEGRAPQWEVISNSTRVPILVPPGPVTQWHEAWRKSGCVHRCDGQRNVLTDELCDPEDPLHLEALAKPTTRLNVVLRDVEGIGVWRTETHGWNAAIELPDVAEFLAAAGGYVEGWLSLEQRTSVDNSGPKPQTHHYVVPIIEVDVTPAQLMAGQGRVATPALEGPVRQAPALEAGPSVAQVDPYEAGFSQVEAATTLERLAELWDIAKSQHLVGPESEPTPRREEFVAAWKQRAHEIKAATEQAAERSDRETESWGEGTVVAEVVDEQGDPDQVWQQVLKVAGELGMSLTDVTADFEQRTAMSPSEASAADLRAYLELLQTEGRAA